MDNWKKLLQELSRKLTAGVSDWAGNPGAADTQILGLEMRLGMALPPSYRAFLKISNGWNYSDWTEMQLLSVEAVEWFSQHHQDWIDAWSPDTTIRPSVPDEIYFVYGEAQDCIYLRREYLQTALAISSPGCDGDILLLIPDVVFEDGEWEAWHFGNKLPGADRYRSFYGLMGKVAEQGCFVP